MTTQTTTSQICSVCREPVSGGFDVFEYSRLGVPQIEIASTPDRNFNVCDWCNATICYRCSDNPESGLCNECNRISGVTIHEDEENKRALTTITMEQGPKIIYEEPKGSELTVESQANRIAKHLSQREADIADFQGRIETLTEKLHEVVNEFAEYIRDIDAAIIETVNLLRSRKPSEPVGDFSATN